MSVNVGAPKTTKLVPAFKKPTGKLERQQGTTTHMHTKVYNPEGINKSLMQSLKRDVKGPYVIMYEFYG